MADKVAKAVDTVAAVHEKVTALTAAQAQFLAECEEDFKSRYTESDAEFVVVKEKSSNSPPILDPWYNKPRRNFDWADRRDRGGGGGDYNRGGRNNQEGGGYRQHRQNHGDNYRRDDRYGNHRQADRYQQRQRPY